MANKYIRFGADLLNTTDNTFALGEYNKKWKDLYVTETHAEKHNLTASNVNKAYLQYNTTDNSIDFIFIS